MATWRFETYENVVTKHTLGKLDWTQAAQYAYNLHLGHNMWTVAAVRMVDADTVEIVKRRDVNKNIIYKMGFDQRGIYERVIINRKEQSVAIDRLDANWLA